VSRAFRVVMVAACPYPTTQGTQVYIRGLVRAMVRRGHEVHLVTYHHGEDLPSEGEILHRIPAVAGYDKLRAGPSWGKPRLDALLLRELDRVVRRVKPDLIHAHNYEAPLAAYAVRRVRRVPVLYHSHNLMSDELHLYVDGGVTAQLARSVAGVLDRQVPRRADRVIVISEAAVEAHRELGVPADRLHHLPPALHPEDFEGAAAATTAPPTVVYAGNPDRYQDLTLLLRAMARVVHRRPDAKLRVVSSATLEDVAELAWEVELSDANLELVTERRWERVRDLLSSSRVAALPRTVCRGFPIKLLNYMALGLPVVASAGSAMIVRDGVHGRVIPDGDDRAFADALLQLLDDDEAAIRMGAAARSSVLAEHTWERRAADLEAIWRLTAA